MWKNSTGSHGELVEVLDQGVAFFLALLGRENRREPGKGHGSGWERLC